MLLPSKEKLLPPLSFSESFLQLLKVEKGLQEWEKASVLFFHISFLVYLTRKEKKIIPIWVKNINVLEHAPTCHITFVTSEGKHPLSQATRPCSWLVASGCSHTRVSGTEGAANRWPLVRPRPPLESSTQTLPCFAQTYWTPGSTQGGTELHVCRDVWKQQISALPSKLAIILPWLLRYWVTLTDSNNRVSVFQTFHSLIRFFIFLQFWIMHLSLSWFISVIAVAL